MSKKFYLMDTNDLSYKEVEGIQTEQYIDTDYWLIPSERMTYKVGVDLFETLSDMHSVMTDIFVRFDKLHNERKRNYTKLTKEYMCE